MKPGVRPLLLNTFDADGGAAIATYRIHRGLRQIGVDATMLVQTKSTADPSVRGPETRVDAFGARFRPRLDGLFVKPYRNRTRAVYSPAMVGDSIAAKVERINPDIVHLFWVTAGLVRIESLGRIRKPMVWTLHDMWPFTGGCHYDAECGRYRESCGKCPVLGSSKNADLSRWVWKRKRAAWADVNLTVVATSNWLADCVRASSLFRNQRVEVLSNALDLSRYKPLDKRAARDAYGLPQDKRLILFSAPGATTDLRKGFQFLIPALTQMVQNGWNDRAEVVVVGGAASKGPDLGLKAHYVGRLGDEVSQVLLYSAADVVVAPSVQENLSNTVAEALACGTPVVAFRIGGMPDMIRHEQSGSLVEPFSSERLAESIGWVLTDEARHRQLSVNARADAVSKYELSAVAGQYRALYEDILR